MAIDIEDFEAASAEALHGDEETVRQLVLRFLAAHPDKAYAREEIRSAIGVETISLIHELNRLEQAGRVRHKGRYWALSPTVDPTSIDGGRVS